MQTPAPRSRHAQPSDRRHTFWIALISVVLLSGPVVGIVAGQDDGDVWIQTQKLTGDSLPQLVIHDVTDRPLVTIGEDDWFGQSFALDHGWLAIGAPGDDPTDQPGSVHLFEKTSTGWTAATTLTQGESGDSFGRAVALNQGTLVVGAPDASMAYVYELSDGSWTQVAAVGDATEGCLGAAVAASPQVIAIAAPCTREAVDIYERGETGWTLEQTLTSESSTQFGSTVALDDHTLVVGTSGKPADVFELGGEGWSHVSALGSSSSRSVAIAGDTIAVGDPLSGEVHMFRGIGDEWQHEATVTPPQDAARQQPKFGAAISLSLDGSLLAVGAPWDDPSPPGTPEVPYPGPVEQQLGQYARQTGAVHVFEDTGATWQHTAKLTAPDARSEYWNGEWFGASVAVDAAGIEMLAGAPRDACCDDPLNGGFVPFGLSPCGIDTSTCLHQVEQADVVYVFERAGTGVLP